MALNPHEKKEALEFLKSFMGARNRLSTLESGLLRSSGYIISPPFNPRGEFKIEDFKGEKKKKFHDEINGIERCMDAWSDYFYGEPLFPEKPLSEKAHGYALNSKKIRGIISPNSYNFYLGLIRFFSEMRDDKSQLMSRYSQIEKNNSERKNPVDLKRYAISQFSGDQNSLRSYIDSDIRRCANHSNRLILAYRALCGGIYTEQAKFEQYWCYHDKVEKVEHILSYIDGTYQCASCGFRR